ncbi:protein-disulfide isomerase [Erwinia sp. MMLR14_017]|uniref:DsbA family protein n=1 Tax=Erwinia sp. MMLR14_017 TaxID=3093842 RepID=UPI0029904C40|nr:protein-disulfide isomerase [Erwinia sp. MMLR14_017]MDW8845046.1 protein-disulfide isomerase [Erwinia sp. MMLR14_017]
MHIDKLQYIFDPLCGWCYASAPALAHLAQHYGDRLELMPGGLFSDEGARQITAQWAELAWTNDQRIASLTGQPFSGHYHQLLLSGARFDSTYMNRALTAFRQIDAAAEAGLLHALQNARYVQGRDTSRSDVVADISAAWALEHHFDVGDDDLAGRLDTDGDLRSLTDQRIAGVKRLMGEKGVSGVPLLLATVDGTEYVISGYDLYGGAESVSVALAALT